MINTIKKDKQVALRLTEETLKRLDKIAMYKKITRSEVIRNIINNSYRQIKAKEVIKEC